MANSRQSLDLIECLFEIEVASENFACHGEHKPPCTDETETCSAGYLQARDRRVTRTLMREPWYGRPNS
jgi:hypothetical protein